MRHGFRPTIEQPPHRHLTRKARQPLFCLSMTGAVVLLTLTIAGMSAWNLKAHHFGKNTYSIHAGDELAMRALSDDLSPGFCSGYQVELPPMAAAYLLPSPARVDVLSIVTSHFALQGGRLTAVGYYLPQYSKIQVKTCRQDNSRWKVPLDVVVIKGEDNFQSWKNDAGCEDCVLKRLAFHENMLCNKGKDARVEVKVNSADSYFIALSWTRRRLHIASAKRPGVQIASVQHPRLEIASLQRHRLQIASAHHPRFGQKHLLKLQIKGTISRTQYNLQDSIKVCNSSTCMFDLPWGSDRDIVVRLSEKNKQHFRSLRQKSLLSSECLVRLPVWFTLFGILPTLFCVGVANVFAFVLCKKRSKKTLAQVQDERGGKGNQTKPSYRLAQLEVLSGVKDHCWTTQHG